MFRGSDLQPFVELLCRHTELSDAPFCSGRLRDKQAEAMSAFALATIHVPAKQADTVKLMRDGTVFNVDAACTDGDVDLFPSFLKEWMRGKTIVCNHVHRRSRSINRLFRALLAEKRILAHCNAYWSPPRAVGAGKHSDDHDVLVLQCHGSKIWELWTGDRKEQVRLRAGEYLWLRKDVPHRPFSQEESSTHLTIGVVRDSDPLTPRPGLRDLEWTRGTQLRFSSRSKLYFDAFESICLGRDVDWQWTEDVSLLRNGNLMRVRGNWGGVVDIRESGLSELLEGSPSAGASLRFCSSVEGNLKVEAIRVLTAQSMLWPASKADDIPASVAQTKLQ